MQHSEVFGKGFIPGKAFIPAPLCNNAARTIQTEHDLDPPFGVCVCVCVPPCTRWLNDCDIADEDVDDLASCWEHVGRANIVKL